MTISMTEFFRRPEVKDLEAYLRLADNPSDVLALRRIANVPARNLSPSYLNDIEQRGRNCGLLLTDLVNVSVLVEDGDPCEYEINVSKRDYVGLDVEATGLDPLIDEIIEIGAIRANGVSGEQDGFHAVLRPNREVGASKSVHRYTDAFIAEHGREPLEVLSGLVEFVANRPLVGHNINAYDMPMLSNNLQRVGLRELRRRTVDTLGLAHRVLALDRYNLERVCKGCGVDTTPTHHALDDAACAIACFKVLTQHLEKTQETRRLLVAKVRSRFQPLAELVSSWHDRARSTQLSELISAILNESGYISHLRLQGGEGWRRLKTLDELRSFVEERFDHLPPGKALREFVQYLSLMKRPDRFSQEEDRVPILTIHSAKGLEFDSVIIPGAYDEGIPAYWTLRNSDDIEEERRLLYVAMTRARAFLELTYPLAREDNYGRIHVCRPSRFLGSAPPGTIFFTND